MTGTTTTIANYGTYTLSMPMTNGSSIEFLNQSGTEAGVLILNDNSQASAFIVTTTTTGGSLTANATVGGGILNFAPNYMLTKGGVGHGDYITLQVISNLFDQLDVAATAATDNASFLSDIQFAAQNGDVLLVLPGDTIKTGPNTFFTLDANQSMIVDKIAHSVLGAPVGGANETLTIGFADRVNPNSNTMFVDAVMTTGQTIYPCFAAGTRILTIRGEVPVEQLQVGDQVITASGAQAPITWTGQREVAFAAHPKPLMVRPIIIEAGALADGVPRRTLTVSPDHALSLDDMLVPAKALLNWTSVRQDLRAEHVTYHHFELARHDIVFAEGCPAESFLDTGHKGVFGPEGITMHPTAMQRRREAESCAPLCESGPKLAAIRTRLAQRLGQRRSRNGLMAGGDPV